MISRAQSIEHIKIALMNIHSVACHQSHSEGIIFGCVEANLVRDLAVNKIKITGRCDKFCRRGMREKYLL